MPSKNPAGNPLALAVLVHLYEKPRHPYDLATVIRGRRKELSIRLNYGSLYTVIEALAKKGQIRALKTTRQGNWPERTVYEITAAGEEHMLAWMRELLGVPVKEYPQFEAALSLLPVLAPEEAMALLQTRVERLKQNVAQFDVHREEFRRMKLPRLFVVENEYYEAMTRAELKFTENLLRDVRSDKGGWVGVWKQVRAGIVGAQKKTTPRKSARGPVHAHNKNVRVKKKNN